MGKKFGDNDLTTQDRWYHVASKISLLKQLDVILIYDFQRCHIILHEMAVYYRYNRIGPMGLIAYRITLTRKL